VPVESPLLRRLYATREWSETQALLTDDLVWHDERGKRPDIDVIAWTRVVVAPCGTRVRELGPTTIIGRLTRNS
jgi:hypothetical protein